MVTLCFLHAPRKREADITTSELQGQSSTQSPLAIITGATGGIGRCIAQQLASRGMRTVLIARDQEKLAALAHELSASAPSIAVPLDLCDIQAIAPTLTQALQGQGRVSTLINNAGFGIYKPMLELDEQEQQSLLQVNLLAPIELIRATLPVMLEHRQGHIINITSIAAKFGPWGHSVYAAAKAGLITLTQSLSIEHQNSGVNFSYVNPGLVDTGFFEESSYQVLFKRMRSRALSPQLVARRIVKLLDRPKLELCIPSRYRLIDTLTAISPNLTRRIVSSQSTPVRGS